MTFTIIGIGTFTTMVICEKYLERKGEYEKAENLNTFISISFRATTLILAYKLISFASGVFL